MIDLDTGSGVEILLLGYDSEKWAKLHNLILNRIAIINQIHLCRFDYCNTNPCSMKKERGRFVALYDGEPLASWGKDLDSVSYAFELVDSFADCCWRIRRAGRLVCVEDM